MKDIASVKTIKAELSAMSHKELIDLVSVLLRYKKENKEVVTYLLFDSKDEADYVRRIKLEIESELEVVNRFRVKQSIKIIRKVLKQTKKAIKISGKAETEVQLLIHFLFVMRSKELPLHRFRVLTLIYERVIATIEKSIDALHEDLRHDYGAELERLLD